MCARNEGTSLSLRQRFEPVGELGIAADPLLDFAPSTNEPGLRRGNASARDLRDLAEIVPAHIMQDERQRLDLVDRFEVREHALHRVANQCFAARSGG